MKKLRAGDPVIVITGKHKGKISTIESLDTEMVLVKGVNEMKKAVKGKGFIKKHLPLHISNIAYYLESEKKPTKVAIETNKDGKKVRTAKINKSVIK